MIGKKNFINQSDGFTLTELLAAILVLSIVIIVFFSFFSQSLLFSSKNESILISSNEADKLAFEVKNYIGRSNEETFSTCDTPVTLNHDRLESLPGITNGAIELNNEHYYPQITICQQPEEQNLGLVRFHIQIFESPEEETEVLSEIYDYIDLNE